MKDNLDSLQSVYTIFVNNNKGLQRVPVSKGSLTKSMNIPLAVLPKSLDREIFIYIFIPKVLFLSP